MNSEQIQAYKPLGAFVGGVVLVLLASQLYNPFEKSVFDDLPKSEEVHVHSDFMMVINDQRLDFTDDKYQSRIDQILLEDFHLHDNNDEVIHRHADNLTLVMFLDSLGYTLTNQCLTTDTNEEYCSNDAEVVQLFVNGQEVADIEGYIPQERDQILVYYGDPNSELLETYFNEVTDDACIYSGTCPERGTPPPESCGLTCEI